MLKKFYLWLERLFWRVFFRRLPPRIRRRRWERRIDMIERSMDLEGLE